ncbi:hypothetical protein Pla8534_69460 [Lignipirellula cremea]|uniref:Uncharacterized protein n=2 Tax=Lignipirellula cremea TaxID=2528010 RepID=A0A518E4L3_9BACT|nr:hypothetical protein Pla8534_69460 [Lignipirellula cremea]
MEIGQRKRGFPADAGMKPAEGGIIAKRDSQGNISCFGLYGGVQDSFRARLGSWHGLHHCLKRLYGAVAITTAATRRQGDQEACNCSAIERRRRLETKKSGCELAVFSWTRSNPEEMLVYARADRLRKPGVSQQTFYREKAIARKLSRESNRGKKKIAGLPFADLQRLKSLAAESQRLQAFAADPGLDKRILQDVHSGKALTTARLRGRLQAPGKAMG